MTLLNRTLFGPGLVLLAAAAMLGSSGCKSNASTTTSAAPSASAPAVASSEPLQLQDFAGLGLRFRYPAPYKTELATSNPAVHQVAVDHDSSPGVLTIRFSPKAPDGIIDLNDLAESTRQNYGEEARVVPSKLKVAGKEYEARAILSNPMGLAPATDTVAVVPMGGKNYVVLTHTANEDLPKASRMFEAVLSSLQAE